MIRERLLWGFVLFALIPLLGVGVATSVVSYYNGRQQSVDRLESVAARKELRWTVRTHVRNILGKLHLANRTQATLYAWREGLAKS